MKELKHQWHFNSSKLLFTFSLEDNFSVSSGIFVEYSKHSTFLTILISKIHVFTLIPLLNQSLSPKHSATVDNPAVSKWTSLKLTNWWLHKNAELAKSKQMKEIIKLRGLLTRNSCVSMGYWGILCNVYNVYDLCDATPNISQTITYTLLYFGYILKKRTKTRSRNRAKKRAEALKHNWKFHIHHTRAPKKKNDIVCVAARWVDIFCDVMIYIVTSEIQGILF